MTPRTLVAAGVCAVLVPLVSAMPQTLDPVAGPGAWVLLQAGASAAGQAPAGDLPVRSARLTQRDAASGLAATIAAIQREDAGPLWLAWSVPAAATRHDGARRVSGDAGRCVLDDEGEFRDSRGTSGPASRLVVLVRGEGTSLTRVAFTDERCTVDAGSRPVYWLSSVAPAQSVALMASLVKDTDRGRRHALPALALHGDPSADARLAELVAAGQPRDIRRDAAFWLGAARGDAGAAVVERLVREDEDTGFREHLTFVLTLTGDRGLNALLDLARRDASTKVRGQALFWLGQKAGQKAVAALDRAIADDPDRDVRKKAVFALSQLPKDDGVPKLIAVARTHRDPEIRKQAMFWLGQSGDDRALAFFEDVLKR
jgi:hypothetical protein